MVVCTFYYQTEQFVYKGITFFWSALTAWPWFALSTWHLIRCLCYLICIYCAREIYFIVESISHQINFLPAELTCHYKGKIIFAHFSLNKKDCTSASLFLKRFSSKILKLHAVKATEARTFLFITFAWPPAHFKKQQNTHPAIYASHGGKFVSSAFSLRWDTKIIRQ